MTDKIFHYKGTWAFSLKLQIEIGTKRAAYVSQTYSTILSLQLIGDSIILNTNKNSEYPEAFLPSSHADIVRVISDG